MNKDPFKEYIKESEPAKRDKGYAWHTAIGLQAVDGLKTSEYLLHTAVRNTTSKTLRVTRLTAPKRPTRSRHGSPRFFPSERSALRLTSIFPSIEGYLPAYIPMPDAFGIITSRKRNGYLAERQFSMAALPSCAQHWIMTSPRRNSFLIKISQWRRLSVTLLYLYPDCGRFMYLERATPERQPFSLSNICARWALM